MKYQKQWLIIITFLVLTTLNGVTSDVFPFNITIGLVVRLLYGTGPTENYNATRYVSTEGLIRHYGYPFEEHEIRTSDGYILKHQRIPHNKTSTESPKINPVIIVPGLFVDSLSYVFNGEFNSPDMQVQPWHAVIETLVIGFIMSNAGYDVWLHNNRGTRYSRKHETMTPDTDNQFWNYSFHEMGLYDLRATVDYVLSYTKAEQVYLIGHSMGGAIITIFLAEIPSYNSKIKGAFLLSPAIKLDHTNVFPGHNEYGLADLIFIIFKDLEILPATEYLPMLASHFCNDTGGIVICSWILRFVLGYDYSQHKDEDLFFDKAARLPAGTSAKTLRHFLQMIERKDFSRYDYGKEKNLEEYGQENPPEYNLRNITTPVSVYCSKYDKTVVDQDVIEISQTFGNLIGLTNINTEGFDHLHFTLSQELKLLLFDKILAEMETLEEEEESPVSCVRDSIYMLLFVLLTLKIIVWFILFLKYTTYRSKS